MKEQNANILFCFKDNTPWEGGGRGEICFYSIYIYSY